MDETEGPSTTLPVPSELSRASAHRSLSDITAVEGDVITKLDVVEVPSTGSAVPSPDPTTAQDTTFVSAPALEIVEPRGTFSAGLEPPLHDSERQLDSSATTSNTDASHRAHSIETQEVTTGS